MHDEVLTLFDDCIDRMLHLRGHLAATRRVHPGERHTTVLAAIEVAEHFASEARRTVASEGGRTVSAEAGRTVSAVPDQDLAAAV
ncbi:hypothetical protein AB0G04_04760 [Actinoplanes sp. NPDC023801]|uniref:hypothetical protein n=1 Tax=Actinoplanes sp. NPDC023801 TaxID=3154595 RepID=UPI0033F21B12